MNLAAYYLVAKNSLQEYFAYRLNFFIWRLQVFISFIVFYFLWVAVAQNRSAVGSYSIPQLYSYFIIGYIIRAIVFSTRTGDLGGEISSGDLNSWLIKPIGVIRLFASRDLIDKFFNLIFMTFEFLIIIVLFRPPLLTPDFNQILIFCLLTIIATAIFFFYSLLVSLITFWSDQAWSSRFLFGVVLINIFSGQTIPLDLLPPPILTILNLTPFPYLYYYPVSYWIGKASSFSTAAIVSQSLVILIVFIFLTYFLWRRGLKKYQSYGG